MFKQNPWYCSAVRTRTTTHRNSYTAGIRSTCQGGERSMFGSMGKVKFQLVALGNTTLHPQVQDMLGPEMGGNLTDFPPTLRGARSLGRGPGNRLTQKMFQCWTWCWKHLEWKAYTSHIILGEESTHKPCDLLCVLIHGGTKQAFSLKRKPSQDTSYRELQLINIGNVAERISPGIVRL